MLQLPLQPAPALTIHKIQALTIRRIVHGCLEGVFALGQLYVLASRVTNPEMLQLVALPPADLLMDVIHAWLAEGLDYDACLSAATSVTGEWEYVPLEGFSNELDPMKTKRLKPQFIKKKRVPVKMKTLEEILNPQPQTALVLHELLHWIDLYDACAQRQEAPPPLVRRDGTPMFQDDEWFLTEFEKRSRVEKQEG